MPASPECAEVPKVPWVVSWTAEEGDDIRPCRFADNKLAAWQPFAQGEGQPVFKVLHRVRHRNAVKNLLCIVCGEPTPPDDRWLATFGQWTRSPGGWLFSTEPPMHERCVDYSLAHCPKLKTEGHTKAQLGGGQFFKVLMPEPIKGRIVAGRGHFLLDQATAMRTFGKAIQPPPVEGYLGRSLAQQGVR